MVNSINRTDQVGSLLRPSNVLDARDTFKTGKIGRGVVEREEDVGILEVLMRQQQIDLPKLRA
jgi:methionine synthase II (cobalamin-independent)